MHVRLVVLVGVAVAAAAETGLFDFQERKRYIAILSVKEIRFSI